MRRKCLPLILVAATACAGASTSRSSGSTPTPGASVSLGEVARPAQSGASIPGQPNCATPDDFIGTTMSGTFASPPEPLYRAGSETLRDLGYAVLENVPPRELLTAPSYAWPANSEREGWHGPEHPGIEMFMYTRVVGDSTQVTIGARALCLVRGPGETAPSATVGKSLESVSTLTAMNAFIRRLQRAP